MATEFSEILARNIIHVSFGEDLSDESITLQVHNGSKYVPKTMTVKEAIYIIINGFFEVNCYLIIFYNFLKASIRSSRVG